ncbi:MAG: hypothetical protein ACTSQA_00660 [Candidatus Heimdallarchaeaceae archaeon]
MDLISLGIVCEDGRTFYAENACFDECRINDRIKEDILANLKWHADSKLKKGFCNAGTLNAGTSNAATEVFGTVDFISNSIVDFTDSNPKFYGYFSNCDWITFCTLRGKITDCLKNWLMHCTNLKHLTNGEDEEGFKRPKDKYDVLINAMWNKNFYTYLIKKEKGIAFVPCDSEICRYCACFKNGKCCNDMESRENCSYYEDEDSFNSAKNCKDNGYSYFIGIECVKTPED